MRDEVGIARRVRKAEIDHRGGQVTEGGTLANVVAVVGDCRVKERDGRLEIIASIGDLTPAMPRAGEDIPYRSLDRRARRQFLDQRVVCLLRQRQVAAIGMHVRYTNAAEQRVVLIALQVGNGTRAPIRTLGLDKPPADLPETIRHIEIRGRHELLAAAERRDGRDRSVDVSGARELPFLPENGRVRGEDNWHMTCELSPLCRQRDVEISQDFANWTVVDALDRASHGLELAQRRRAVAPTREDPAVYEPHR